MLLAGNARVGSSEWSSNNETRSAERKGNEFGQRCETTYKQWKILLVPEYIVRRVDSGYTGEFSSSEKANSWVVGFRSVDIACVFDTNSRFNLYGNGVSILEVIKWYDGCPTDQMIQ